MAGLIPTTEVDDANALAQAAPRGAVAPDDLPEAGAFTGIAKGAGLGVMRGGAKFVQGVNLAGGALPFAYDTLTGNGTQAQDAYFGRMVAPLDDAVHYWTPDARTVGAVGNVLGGLGEAVLPAMAAGSAGFVGTTEIGTAKELVDKGVSAGTAVTAGIATGATNALGLHIPILGETLATRLATGVVGNLATGTASTATQHAVLADAGFTEQAKAFEAWDPTARSLDVAMGLAFGGLTHLSAPRGTLAQQDALLTVANAQRVQTTSAPARPATAAGQAAHGEAFDAALAAVARGEKVDVASLIDPADFHIDQPNPRLAPVVAEAHSTAILANLDGPRATVRDAALAAGVDPQTTLAIAQIESGFNVNAKNKVSSATGIGQFLDSTWAAMGGTGANRFDEAAQARILAEFTKKNTDDLRETLGREPAPHEVYLAHLLGIAGARKFLRADPAALVSDVSGKTVAEAAAKWKAKIERAGAEPLPAREAAPQAPIAPREAPTVGTEVAGAPEAAGASPAAAATKPLEGIQADYETARQTAEANPNLVVHDDDGVPMLANDAIAQTDAHIAEQDHFAAAYEVAVNCALRGGH